MRLPAGWRHLATLLAGTLAAGITASTLLWPTLSSAITVPDDSVLVIVHTNWVYAQHPQYHPWNGDLESVAWYTWQSSFALFGETPRFQPSYWFIKLSELATLGLNTNALFALHAAYLATFLFGVFSIVRVRLGLFAGMAAPAAVMTGPWWGDIYARSLGAAELYAAPGVGMVLVAAAVLLANDRPAARKAAWACALGAVGVVIAAGSKENFVFLGIAVLALCFIAHKRSGSTKAALVSASLALVWCGLIAVAIILGVLVPAVDVYGQSRTLLSGLESVVHSPAWLWSIAAIGLWLPLIAIQCRRRRSTAEPALIHFWVAVFVACWITWELYFYNGPPPPSSRYQFPVALLPAAQGLILLSYLQTHTRVVGAVAAIGWSGLALFFGFPLRADASLHAQASQRFDRDLNRLAALAAAAPERPIILEAEPHLEYEPSMSWTAFLRWKGIENPAFLRVANGDPASPRTVEMTGLSDRGERLYRPISELPAAIAANHGCISVSFVGAPSSECDQVKIRGSWSEHPGR